MFCVGCNDAKMEAVLVTLLKVLLCISIQHVLTAQCYQTGPAQPCNDEICKLPDCFCSGTKIPGGLNPKDVPQMVTISFDDSVNIQNFKFYEILFNSGFRARKNPNGKCRVLAVSHNINLCLGLSSSVMIC